jgi:hypothetical protein
MWSAILVIAAAVLFGLVVLSLAEAPAQFGPDSSAVRQIAPLAEQNTVRHAEPSRDGGPAKELSASA